VLNCEACSIAPSWLARTQFAVASATPRGSPVGARAGRVVARCSTGSSLFSAAAATVTFGSLADRPVGQQRRDASQLDVRAAVFVEPGRQGY
jgi:hypothetical protein